MNARPDKCLLRPGNTNCGGCGMSIGLTMLGRALDEAGDNCTLVIPACCGIVTAGAFPTTSYGVPTLATTFASSPAVASGVASIRDLNEESGQVICWAGDGGTYDIGLATLSAAAERNENIIYICYDNEIYGNTGGQRSSATPAGARTATTPYGKTEGKKDIMSIMAAHRIPYAATMSIAHPAWICSSFSFTNSTHWRSPQKSYRSCRPNARSCSTAASWPKASAAHSMDYLTMTPATPTASSPTRCGRTRHRSGTGPTATCSTSAPTWSTR
mgnify:CR=1 FL=1